MTCQSFRIVSEATASVYVQSTMDWTTFLDHLCENVVLELPHMSSEQCQMVTHSHDVVGWCDTFHRIRRLFPNVY
jgi:hypothetical protein